MIGIGELLSMEKEDIPAKAENLHKEDLAALIRWLDEKDDKIRYPAFLLLLNRSGQSEDVYPFWDVFVEKLNNENSYQRSIGLMLLAENARWDSENRLDEVLDSFLRHVSDEKPITARQCIQALHKIVPCKKHLLPRIADALMSVDLSRVRETMRKSILTDIAGVLAAIRKIQPYDAIDHYLFTALSGTVLDRKAQKEIEAMLA